MDLALPDPYLQVILPMHGQPVTKYIPCDNHIGFHAIHGKTVHAKKLGKKCVPMAFHYELKGHRVEKKEDITLWISWSVTP